MCSRYDDPTTYDEVEARPATVTVPGADEYRGGPAEAIPYWLWAASAVREPDEAEVPA